MKTNAKTLGEGETAQSGDIVNIDYVGKVDGKEFDGGSTDGQGTDLELGSGSYVEGFEDQLVGAKAEMCIRDRRWIQKPGKRLLISVLVAMSAVIFQGGGNIQMTQGFWGILDPEYCYSEKPSDEISAKPRFTFRWLRTPNFGDKIGEKHQSESSYEIR